MLDSLNSMDKFSVEKAEKMQRVLSKMVITYDCLPSKIKYIAGVDVSYSNEKSYGAAVVLDYATMRVIEEKIAVKKTSLPYIPTFLAFRELPVAISAVQKLEVKPDVFMIDGHGRAHPRRLGLASHFGLIVDAPTIGVAKNLLCGKIRDIEDEWKPIVDGNEIIGAAVFSGRSKRPIYVSVGHKISLESAIKIVLNCAKYRIPEPIRFAHAAAENAKRKIESLKTPPHHKIL